MVPAPGDLPTSTHLVEATKTEPDKNTYLVLHGQNGPDHAYNYGTHFVFQGHEGGSPGFLSRINLDADGAHRVTLMASKDTNGDPLPVYDGSTWDPFARRLLLTTESNSGPSVYQATLHYPSRVAPLDGVFGRATTRASRPTRPVASGWSRTPVERSAPPTRMPSSRTASSTGSPRATRTTCGPAANWRRCR